MAIRKGDFLLKDGRRAHLEEWNYDDLAEFVTRKSHPLEERPGKTVIKGFSYLRPSLADDLRETDKTNPYSSEKNLSEMETQPDNSCPNESYHRAIVAKDSETGAVMGATLLVWKKDDRNFWRYRARFVDVHSDYKNNGVGTALVQAIDGADFLK